MDIDGKKIASEFHDRMRKEVQVQNYSPTLVFLLVGNDHASQTYVRMKEKACAEVGITSKKINLPHSITENELLEELQKFNLDVTVDGILVQMPLPIHINENKIINCIDPSKDVDGFHPLNIGKMILGDGSGFIPCTPLGILKIIEETNVDVTGKNVVVVGRSNIVGRPLANLFSQKRAKTGNATVTLAHSYSKDLNLLCKSADILIAAIGKAKFITAEMVKPGAIVIDVGINRSEKSIVGDVDYEPVSKLCSWITPVPGGVGPMTIAMLMYNTLKSCRMRKQIEA